VTNVIPFVAVVTAQPGSRSRQSVQRRGFDLLYIRAILVLPRDARSRLRSVGL
jgi:hypothetical protein